MKNAINYYYNLEVSDIHLIDGDYKFQIGKERYIFLLLKYPYNVDKLYEISKNVYNTGVYTHQMIQNKDKNLVTVVNDKPYLLLWYYQEMNQLVQLKDIIEFTESAYPYEEANSADWGNLWANKIDYFEYQISEFKQKYPIIRQSINYFIGIAETGISLFNASKMKYDKVVIAHNRICPNNTLFDLYNPLNFVIDIKVRDTAEYFKARFMKEDKILEMIKKYLLTANLDSYQLLMFYIRFFYPSFYFDLYEKIVSGKIEEKQLIQAIDKANEYEILLKNLYHFISQYMAMPDVEWIKKT